MKRLIERFERIYPFFATAVLAAAATAVLVLSPVGAKIAKAAGEAFEKDEATGVGFIGKFRNDWGFYPERFLHADHKPPPGRFRPVEAPFAERRTARPLVYSRDKERNDAFVIVGAFEFEEGLHGALLIDRKGEVLHRWPIPPGAARRGVFREDYRVFPHGFALARDGSAVVAFDNGERLIRIDACGRLLWRRNGGFHHVAVADPERADEAWAFRVDAPMRFALATGEEIEGFRMPRVEAANPELDLFGVRQKDAYDESVAASDPVHFNDVDPLPAALAPAFPMFSAGDLLVSARSLNLVFVVDRKTRKVKWHANGYWRRQHDPDWGRDGRIYVFNNNMNRGPSSIVAIDPATNEFATVVDGARYGLYTNIRGKQQWSPDGRVVLAVSQQGRAVEIDESGEIAFEFLNRYDSSERSLVVSDAFRVDRTTLDFDALKACGK